MFLGGYSQGARMVWNVAGAHLDLALGGYFSIAAAPQYPFLKDVELSAYSYFGDDMRWFILMGDNDQIYSSEFSLLELESVMTKLDHEVNDVVRYWEVVGGIGHELDPRYLKFMM